MAAQFFGIKTIWLMSALSFSVKNPLIIESFALSFTSRSSKRQTPRIESTIQQQHFHAKPWRYAQPKKTKWDVRHTKSFRFELYGPRTQNEPPLPLTLSCNQSMTPAMGIQFDCLPMHKKPRESLSHVLGKGLLWALFKDQYGSPESSHANADEPLETGNSILVETPIPGETHFVPDVVAFHRISTDYYSTNKVPSKQQRESQQQQCMPLFWGESGRMSAEKAAALACNYPHTHLVHLRWGYPHQIDMSIFEDIETAVLPFLQKRTAPFEFALLPGKPQDFVNEDGMVSLQLVRESIQWRTVRFDIDLNY